MPEPSWKEIPTGGLIVKPGNADNYKTGGWRTYRPIRDPNKCTNCLLCFIYCPDSAIKVKDGKISHIDYDHCKGCLICEKECPVKAISHKSETEIKE
ncbi:4Fe-4S binding protein [Candidatus Woesearchaeota archaeon]|nr:4Fe-4S binding protein [Candidatus Woesearchaeota archaeon]